jgi:DNA helicase-2/ATP-dependent DNA helicase PcrA
LYDTALKTEGKELPSESAFIGYFGDFLSRQPLNPQQRATHLQKHLPELRAYYQQRVSVWEQELKSGLIWTERGFKQLEIEGVPVTGTVDKLILQKNETGSFWKLVDYKTGKLQPERLSPPSPQQPNGGVYWRQLIFYKLLLEGSGLSPYKIKLAEIDYLSPNSEGIFEQKRLEVRPEDAQFVKKLIKDTYEKIQAQAFDEGCGRPSCKWCAFVQNQQTAPSFNHEEVESLDERNR